jgi:hypothetical protein
MKLMKTESQYYDPNGNLSYESVSRKRYDDSSTQRRIIEGTGFLIEIIFYKQQGRKALRYQKKKQ